MTNNTIKSVTIGVPVSDLAKAIEWYRKLLPKREELVPMEGLWEIALTSSTWLQLFESDAQESTSQSINLETDDIVASHNLVMSLGVTAKEIETIPETVKYFEFKDPFGNNFSFVQVLAQRD